MNPAAEPLCRHGAGGPPSLVRAGRRSHPPRASATGQSGPGGAPTGPGTPAGGGLLFQLVVAGRRQLTLVGRPGAPGESRPGPSSIACPGGLPCPGPVDGGHRGRSPGPRAGDGANEVGQPYPPGRDHRSKQARLPISKAFGNSLVRVNAWTWSSAGAEASVRPGELGLAQLHHGRSRPRLRSAGVDGHLLLHPLHRAAGHGQGEVEGVDRAAHRPGVGGQLGQLVTDRRFATTTELRPRCWRAPASGDGRHCPGRADPSRWGGRVGRRRRRPRCCIRS